MVVIKNVSLKDFEAWSGGAQTLEYLTDKEIIEVEAMINDIFPNGATETQINDFLWFEDDMIAEWLGYENFDEIINR